MASLRAIGKFAIGKEDIVKQFVVALLAAFALSSPAFAGSIDYSTGNFVSAKFTGSFLSSINIYIKGNLHEVDINTGTLIKNTGFVQAGGPVLTLQAAPYPSTVERFL